MTADELRDRVQAAGGRGTWEYYRATADHFVVTIVADYAGKTWTNSVAVTWGELAQRTAGADSFERLQMAPKREEMARMMKLPKSAARNAEAPAAGPVNADAAELKPERS